ncbi:MAG: GNAT family N-acetyltransferase [Opitutaceae bacterium]|jgi:GNAT superfamily N-acetyltransferase
MSDRETEPQLSHPVYRGVRLTETDAHAGWLLSSGEQWAQTEDDWRFLLTRGIGFGFETSDGALAASAVLFPYEQRFAWIGMVLVAASARRQGLATSLLQHALRLSQTQGLPLLLDATPAGRHVYAALGFHDLRRLTRWRSEAPDKTITTPQDLHQRGQKPDAGSQMTTVGPIETTYILDEWAEWDEPRFGASRRAQLYFLWASRPELALHLADAKGERLGYCLGRAGRTATQLGPLVAETETDALALLRASLNRTSGPVLIDLIDGRVSLERELTERGFMPQRNFVRMGSNLAGEFGRPECTFAIAGPEFG